MNQEQGGGHFDLTYTLFGRPNSHIIYLQTPPSFSCRYSQIIGPVLLYLDYSM